MRFLLFFALLFTLPVEAKPKAAKTAKAEKTAPKMERKLASKNPRKVVTVLCISAEDNTESALGIFTMIVNRRDENKGSYSSNLYVQSGQTYEVKQNTGEFTRVPNGYVFRASWKSEQSPYVFIHAHPNGEEKTRLPELGDHFCKVTGEINSAL